MKIKGDYIVREIAGENIVIPVGAAALEIHGMMSLTESGLLLWNELQEDKTEDNLVTAIMNEYEIDEATAMADVREFLGKLNVIGVLERS